MENDGIDSVSEVLLPFPDDQAKNLAFLMATIIDDKGKSKTSSNALPVKVVNPEGMPPALTWYSVSLPKELGKGERLTLEIRAVFTHTLRPFPEKITQADSQLVLFQDSAYYLSPYTVKTQLLTVKLPEPRVESYTKLENTKLSGSEIKYGPYENLPAFSYRPVMVHFVSNGPFAVAQELVREIEISHWGNVQITENYNLIHAGAQTTGEFSRYFHSSLVPLLVFLLLSPLLGSPLLCNFDAVPFVIFERHRLDYQARPHVRGASAFRHLIAKLPPRAHSVYYRDEIGNISTSNLWSDSTKVVSCTYF